MKQQDQAKANRSNGGAGFNAQKMGKEEHPKNYTAFTSAGARGRVRMKEGAMWARGLMKHFSLTARLRFAYAELTAMFRINFGN